jgi:phenylacetate-CoA ligase
LSTEFKREKDLINEFKNYFGEDAIIAVEYVNEIPLLNSGKRKKVMNLML